MEDQGGAGLAADGDVFSYQSPSQNNLPFEQPPPLYDNHLASPSLSAIDRFLSSSPLEISNHSTSQDQNILNHNFEMPFSNFPSDHQPPIDTNNFYFFNDLNSPLDGLSNNDEVTRDVLVAGSETQNLDNNQGQSNVVDDSNHIKGQWSMEEDRKLLSLVNKHGPGKWARIAHEMSSRDGKQCSDRWKNHLRPGIKKDSWTAEEENMLIEAHQILGNKWSEIAKSIPRSENSIKNHWYATKRKQSSKRRRMKNSEASKHSMLQDYIQTEILKEGKIHSSKDSNTPTQSTNNSNSDELSNNFEIPSVLSPLEDSTSLIQPTYDDELSFLQNLFSTNTNKAPLIDDQANMQVQENSIPPDQENMQIQENVPEQVTMQPIHAYNQPPACNVSDILNGIYDTPYLDYCFDGSPYIDKFHQQQRQHSR